MSLKSLARRLPRRGQEFLMLTEEKLWAYAQRQRLTPRQAVEAALKEGIFPECYERNFPSLSVAQQLILFQSSVLVVGLGGLGGILSVLLARVGIGRLFLADGDIFTPSNLNRQMLATLSTLGQNKALGTARHLQDLSPALIAQPIPYYLNRDNLPPYLSQVQVALDALDTLKARQELFAAAQEARVPLVHGAVLGKFGQVTTITPEDTTTFTKIYPAPALGPEAPREALAPTVTLIASLQTQETIRLLLGQPAAYRGKLAHFDGETGRLEILPLS